MCKWPNFLSYPHLVIPCGS